MSIHILQPVRIKLI